MSGPAPTSRLLKGYGPLAGLMALFAAMAIFVPSVTQEIKVEQVAESKASTSAATPTDEAVASETTIAGPTDTTVSSDPAATASPGGSTSGSGSTGAGKSGTTAPGAKQGPAADGAAPAPANTGTAALSSCGDFQVKSDPYSPPCVKFSGANGGATSRGVTADKITVSLRFSSFSKGMLDAVADAASLSNIRDSEEDLRRTIVGLVDYFNRTYQFYGRKIDIQMFNGRANILQETLGADKEGANSDAIQVAQEIKAFADVSAVSEPFAAALSQYKVVNIGAPYLSRAWFAEHQPYAWSSLIDCSKVVESVVSYYSARMAGRPATLAGGDLNGLERKFGVVAPLTPWYNECVDDGLALGKKSGLVPVTRLSYALDLKQMDTNAKAVIPKLKAAGVTTVVCGCDPLMLMYSTAEASAQNYYPEWLVTGVALADLDLVGKLFDQKQWKRAIGVSYSGAGTKAGRGPGYAAFKAVRPNEEPALAVDLMYAQFQVLAIGLQMAGPNLTPESFAAGMAKYPKRTGPLGVWGFGPGDTTPMDTAREIYWSPSTKSAQTDELGAYIEAQPNARYPIGSWPAGDATIPGLTP